jgi:hypothetical protein
LAVDAHDDWARKVANEIQRAEEHISTVEQKRYKLPLLLRLAQRVAAFSSECEVCQGLQSQIVSLGASLSGAPRITRKNLRSYLGIVKDIAKHLKRTHGLVEERQYVKRYVFISLTIGLSLVLLGLILLNFGITLLALSITLPALATRVVFGYTIGHFLDRRAKRRGKVL